MSTRFIFSALFLVYIDIDGFAVDAMRGAYVFEK